MQVISYNFDCKIVKFLFKLKTQLHILRTLPLVIFLLVTSFSVYAQQTSADTLNNKGNSINVASAGDSTAKADTLKPVQKEGDIKTNINYSSRDSIRFNVIDKIIYLYGDAKIVYGDINLVADRIDINWKTNIMTATGTYDSTGKYIGRPQFSDNEDKYQADTIRYNMITKKGLIVNVVTQEGEGYIHAGKGKKDEYNNFFFNSAKYTTCNLAEPHFHISAKRLKVIPEDKVISGPFNLKINNVPTPFGFFLGFFPLPEKRKSGIIFPQDFGEHNTRGFYFTQAGYYLAIRDYVGVALKGDVYSNGSYRTTLETNYRNRYKYTGNVNFNYSKIREGFDEITPESYKPNYYLTWLHSTESKTGGRFSANVSAGSYDFNRNFSYNPNRIISAALQSNISYQTSFRNTPFNLTAALSLDQNTVTKVTNIKFPAINFSMNRIYPFKKKIGSTNSWYENIFISYNLNTEFRLTNVPTTLSMLREMDATRYPEAGQAERFRPFWLDTLSFKGENSERFLNRSQYYAIHDIPIGTTIKPKKTFLKYFSINPNFTWREFWYPQQLDFTDKDSVNKLNQRFVNIDTTINEGFARGQDYNFNVSVNTWLYGTAQFRKGKIAGIRHSISPNFGFTYKPNFGDPKFGKTYFRYTDPQLNGQFNYVSRFSGFSGGQPSLGENRNLTFGLDNTLEAKYRTKDTANPTKKFKLLDRFGFNGFYNFAADSFNLSNLNVYANTRLLNIFDIRFSGTFDPYLYRKDSSAIVNNIYTVYQKRIDTLSLSHLWKGTDSIKIGGFTSTQFSVGGTFGPDMFKRKTVSEQANQQLKNIIAYPDMYVDFNIPWTLTVNYVLNVTQLAYNSATVSQSVTLNGDLKLTENWKFGYTVWYDITNKGFAPSRFELFRDLHCWQMSIAVNLFSTQQSYMFTIRPKAGILQDLRLNKRSPGSFGNPSFY
jgi:lipopolysaccharide assembly outer membrane protein LptD (OstA)